MENSKISKIGLVFLGLTGLGLGAVVLPQNLGAAGSADLGHAVAWNVVQTPQVAGLVFPHAHEDAKPVAARDDEERRNAERIKVKINHGH